MISMTSRRRYKVLRYILSQDTARPHGARTIFFYEPRKISPKNEFFDQKPVFKRNFLKGPEIWVVFSGLSYSELRASRMQEMREYLYTRFTSVHKGKGIIL